MKNGTAFILPQTITKIEVYAFDSNKSIERIIIPEGVTEIGNYAFSDCTNLTSEELHEFIIEM